MAIIISQAEAQVTPINYSLGSTYSQNFNSLAIAGTSSALPAGWTMLETGNKANTTYDATDGSTDTHGVISYGAHNSTDRALGTRRDTQLQPLFGVAIKNTTGATLTHFTVGYTTELWMMGGNAAQTDRLAFEYSVTATSLANGTSGMWTAVPDLDATTPNLTGTPGARDGNKPRFRAVKKGTFVASVPNNSTLWIHFVDTAKSGPQADGLAIDDFTFRAATSAAVDLVRFKALAVSGGVWLKWKTGLEVDNVGFNLYRQRLQDDGSWGPKVKLNDELIASATLQGSPRLDQDGGFLYGWPDPNPGNLLRFRYWLEDVEIAGIKTMHGPIYPQIGSGGFDDRVKSPTLSEIAG